jgi:hypothetical protein
VGQAEWMLVVTIGSLVGVAGVGFNLVAAIWSGRPPHPVPISAWLGIMLLSASVLWTRWDEDDTNTIIAAVATAEPVCSTSGISVSVAARPGGGRLDGRWTGSRGCHLWALIQDPRTGTFWVQGPAFIDGPTWTLPLALAAPDATESLAYLVNLTAVDDEQHLAWLAEALAAGGILSLNAPPSIPWLAHDIPMETAAQR